MPQPDQHRRAELIAAAIAGELTRSEAAELDVLRALDPTIDPEIAELRAIVARVETLDPREDGWLAAAPGDELRARIAALADAQSDPAAPRPVDVAAGASAPPTSPRNPRAVRVRTWMIGATAAAGLAIGVGLGTVVPGLLASTPSGPPGTLGAVEQVVVDGVPSGTSIEADVIAHTWGTEAVLDATGLAVGSTYEIVLIGSDGTEFSAGEMLGSSVPIHCSLNAAVLREDVAGLEIRDSTGDPVATAVLPPV